MKIKLNNNEIEVGAEKSLLDICRENGINVPTLCYHASMTPEARCRVCLVEMDGKLVTSCSTKPREGAKIVTNSERVMKARRLNMELMVPEPSCKREDDYEVCQTYKEVGMGNARFSQIKDYNPDLGSAVIRDNNKCINLREMRQGMCRNTRRLCHRLCKPRAQRARHAVLGKPPCGCCLHQVRPVHTQLPRRGDFGALACGGSGCRT